MNLFAQTLVDSIGTAVAPDSLAKPAIEESKSLFDILVSGGPLMIVLAIFSFLALVIVIERFRNLRRSTRNIDDLTSKVFHMIDVEDDLEGAKKECRANPDVLVSNVFLQGLSALGTGVEAMKEVVETAASNEIHKLEKHLGSLSTIAALAPMVGFLGTVTGMVRVFMIIARMGGGVNIEYLAGGISEALITTVGGLVVGIFAILFYNHFVSRIEERAHDLEQKTGEFILIVRRLS